MTFSIGQYVEVVENKYYKEGYVGQRGIIIREGINPSGTPWYDIMIHGKELTFFEFELAPAKQAIIREFYETD